MYLKCIVNICLIYKVHHEVLNLSLLTQMKNTKNNNKTSFQNENSNVNLDAVSKCSFPTENSNKDNKNNKVATTSSDKAQVVISSWNCEICDNTCKKEMSLNAHMLRKHPTIQQLDGNSSLISPHKIVLGDYLCPQGRTSSPSNLKKKKKKKTEKVILYLIYFFLLYFILFHFLCPSSKCY